MPDRIIFKTKDGKSFEVVNEVKGRGTKKNVYFSKDKSFVIGVFKNNPESSSLNRLEDLVTKYREEIFNKEGGEYWAKRFCWPSHIVYSQSGKIGLVFPIYPSDYFFSQGMQKGIEKKASWFTKPFVRKEIDKKELGTWRKYLLCCFHLSRTVRRMHAAGLAHSDLSFNNVLINPLKGSSLVIDIDELVVPGKYVPGVIGTTGFIAPEVLKTHELSLDDSSKCLPRRTTDLHALACLIYLYLLRRHPLEGLKVHSSDPDIDDIMAYGEKALFVENSLDSSNPPKIMNYKPVDWTNVKTLPYTITGPFISKLIKQAFEKGLHNPEERPTAGEWESAILKTLDIVIPCENLNCSEKEFVFNKTKKCPFCQTKLQKTIPVIDIYRKDSKTNDYVFAKKQIIGHHFKKLYLWNFFSNKFLSEISPKNERQFVAYLQHHNNKWYFVNKYLNNLSYVENSIEYRITLNGHCEINADTIISLNEPFGYQFRFKII
jgi:DNA-binding helix-hairpin-helix protein with protein kinase domain